jgi:hypothetical protein
VPGGLDSGKHEDADSDDAPDAKGNQVPDAEGLLQRMARFGRLREQLNQGFCPEQRSFHRFLLISQGEKQVNFSPPFDSIPISESAMSLDAPCLFDINFVL